VKVPDELMVASNTVVSGPIRPAPTIAPKSVRLAD